LIVDEIIADIKIAEDPLNEERVDQESWAMAMKLEKDQMEDEVESEEEWEEELTDDDSQLHPPKYGS